MLIKVEEEAGHQPLYPGLPSLLLGFFCFLLIWCGPTDGRMTRRLKNNPSMVDPSLSHEASNLKLTMEKEPKGWSPALSHMVALL